MACMFLPVLDLYLGEDFSPDPRHFFRPLQLMEPVITVPSSIIMALSSGMAWMESILDGISELTNKRGNFRVGDP